jgi:hypothetical protein
MAEHLNDTYNKYKQKYSFELSIIKAVKNIDVDAIGDKIIKVAMDTINPLLDLFPYLRDLAKVILAKLQDNSYIMFVKCVDEAGNENTKPFFVTFTLDVNSEDTYPPEFVESKPENNSEIFSNTTTINMLYYVNEPADCKADTNDIDYEQMAYSLECEKRSLAMSNVGFGSYECKGELPFEGNESIYYFRCRDNPAMIDEYYLTLLNASNTSYHSNNTEYFNVTGDVVSADSHTIESGDYMYVKGQSIFLNLYLDNDVECKYVFDNSSYDEAMFSFSPCVESDKKNIGLFMCSAPIIIPDSIAEKNTTLKVMCKEKSDRQRNTNQQSEILHFNRSKDLRDLLAIDSSNIWIGNAYYRSGSDIKSSSLTLKAVLSKKIIENGIICGYYRKREDGVIAMKKSEELIYEAELSNLAIGPHSYSIECNDKWDNNIRTQVNFTVVSS